MEFGGRSRKRSFAINGIEDLKRVEGKSQMFSEFE